MSKSNLVTWSVELTEANAPLIDKINTLLVPGYTGPSSTNTASKEAPAKKEKPAKISMKDIKNAAKAASKEHSTGFVLECIEAVDVDTEDLTLPKAVSAVETSEYPKLLSLLDAGPTDSDDDDDFGDDDDDDFEDDNETVSSDDVKTACKAYKEENGIAAIKKIFKQVGVAKYGDIEDLSAAKLTKLFGLVA